MMALWHEALLFNLMISLRHGAFMFVLVMSLMSLEHDALLNLPCSYAGRAH
jgi:hypothetical protein